METTSISASSKSNRAIVAAIEAGYYADTLGNIYRPNGDVQIQCKRSGYYCFNTNKTITGHRIRLWSHRFLAAHFFGTEVLLHACVRHLDGNRSIIASKI